jgi:hypothetical protein
VKTSISDLLHEACRRWSGREALGDGAESLAYADLAAAPAALGRALAALLAGKG